MNVTRAAIVSLLLVSLFTGCAQRHEKSPLEAGAGSTAVGGETAKPGSFLAYEHDIRFQVAPDTMKRRVADVQAACNEERFGTCSVLAIETSTGDAYFGARIMVRVAPSAVEQLVELAGDDNELSRRNTRAEDMADAVADVAAKQDSLNRQRTTLLGYLERKDIAVADMITVSQQLAILETTLQTLTQQAADQRRRIESNKLTIDFVSNDSAIGFSFGNVWDTFVENLAEGTDIAAESTGYFLPMVPLIFLLALIWRWLWRWATRKSRKAVAVER